MKKLTICLEDEDALFLENEAYGQKRPFKCQIEFIVMEYIRNKSLNNVQAIKKTINPEDWKPKYNNSGIICADNNPENDPDYIINDKDTEFLKKKKREGAQILPQWA